RAPRHAGGRRLPRFPLASELSAALSKPPQPHRLDCGPEAGDDGGLHPGRAGVNLRLYILQRATAALLAPLVLMHLSVILYATGHDLTAAPIFDRRRPTR